MALAPGPEARYEAFPSRPVNPDAPKPLFPWGPAVTDVGGRDVDFIGSWITLRF